MVILQRVKIALLLMKFWKEAATKDKHKHKTKFYKKKGFYFLMDSFKDILKVAIDRFDQGLPTVKDLNSFIDKHELLFVANGYLKGLRCKESDIVVTQFCLCTDCESTEFLLLDDKYEVFHRDIFEDDYFIFVDGDKKRIKQFCFWTTQVPNQIKVEFDDGSHLEGYFENQKLFSELSFVDTQEKDLKKSKVEQTNLAPHEKYEGVLGIVSMIIFILRQKLALFEKN